MRIVQLLAIVLLSSTSASATENWPQYRGPNGDGKALDANPPVSWSETENIAWKTPIPGKAWSSPVVWGDAIWLTNATAEGHEMYALEVNLQTGRVLQNIKVFHNERPRFCHPTNSYASCTPVVEQDRLYVHYGSYGSACLDTATGRILWERRDFDCDHFRAPASSPVVHGNLLFLTFDGIDLQYVVALDKRTGKTVWKRDRDIDYGTDNGDLKKGYCTPSIFNVAGREQLISPSASATISYNPLDGEELWRVRHGGMNAAARPVLGNGLVYVCTSDGGLQLTAVRPDGTGDVTETHLAWNQTQGVPHRSSLILQNNLLFMVSDAGIASCRDAKSGRLIRRKRLEGHHWASPVFANGRIYFSSKQGVTRVLSADRELRLLSQNQLDAGINASPAVIGDTLIVRTFTHLYRIERSQ